MKKRVAPRFLELGKDLADQEKQEEAERLAKPKVTRVGEDQIVIPDQYQTEYRLITRFPDHPESKRKFLEMLRKREEEAYSRARNETIRKLNDLRRYHKKNEGIAKELTFLIDSIRPRDDYW